MCLRINVVLKHLPGIIHRYQVLEHTIIEEDDNGCHKLFSHRNQSFGRMVPEHSSAADLTSPDLQNKDMGELAELEGMS